MAEGDKSSTAGRGLFTSVRQATARLGPERAALWLAAASAVLGLAIAVSSLGRGAWLDEFWTLASTIPETPPGEFFAIMARDVHPLLHYGLVYVVRLLGLEDLSALRALNVLGVPMVAGSLWLAHRRGAVAAGQRAVLVALYASSTMSLLYFAELRAYFLVFSASIAVALLWRTLARADAEGRPWDLLLLAAWGASLAVFVNLHYFATLLGGVMTLALLVLRRGRGVLPLAGVSLLAAAPAVATAGVQAFSADAGIVGWVQSGRIDAAFVMVDAAWGAAGHNVAAVGCAVAAALFALERRTPVRELRDEVVLAGVLLAYAAILLGINLFRPIIVERYLVAGGGPVVLLTALLAGGAGAPRWGPAAACAFALVVQGRGLYARAFNEDGWETSARFVAELAADCPDARVLVDPTGFPSEAAMYIETKRYGLRYYADQFDIRTTELFPGDRVPDAESCPSLLWLEHYAPSGTTSGDDVLAALELRADGEVDLLRIGSGVVLVVR